MHDAALGCYYCQSGDAPEQSGVFKGLKKPLKSFYDRVGSKLKDLIQKQSRASGPHKDAEATPVRIGSQFNRKHPSTNSSISDDDFSTKSISLAGKLVSDDEDEVRERRISYEGSRVKKLPHKSEVSPSQRGDLRPSSKQMKSKKAYHFPVEPESKRLSSDNVIRRRSKISSLNTPKRRTKLAVEEAPLEPPIPVGLVKLESLGEEEYYKRYGITRLIKLKSASLAEFTKTNPIRIYKCKNQGARRAFKKKDDKKAESELMGQLFPEPYDQHLAVTPKSVFTWVFST